MTDITIINVATGEVTERTYSKSERDLRAELENNPPQEVIDIRSQEQYLEDSESIALKQSALDKLQALGLTLDEAKAIVGI
jgi:sugar-specific transcriptional regulator TrmB